MTIRNCILVSALLVTFNAWAELEILQTGISLAPADQPPERQIGHVWNGLQDGDPYSAKLIGRTASTETWEDSTGCTWTRGKFFAPSTEWSNCNGSTGTSTVRFRGGKIFPLQVGNEWSYERDGGDWRTNVDCEIEDAVRVKTDVGEHDTFKIVCADKWNTRTRYYSPKLQTAVHSERHRRTKGQRIKWEFVKFE